MTHEPDASFLAAALPLRGELRAHCYRMLGSSSDNDDVVQETMLRAWRSKESLSEPALLRPWLYRIATNVCLDELKKRPKRVLTHDEYRALADPTRPLPAPIDDPVWLEPMPDAWLDGAPPLDPAARYTLKESVALAFVAALQCLSAPQRAALLLRDVVGLSAEESAEALAISVSAVNSALFRAREAVAEKLAGRGSAAFAESSAPVDEELLARYVRAFEDGDLDALVAVLHRDVRTTMPPIPAWIDGFATNEIFYRLMFSNMRPGRIRLVRTRANGQTAFGFYRPEGESGRRTLHAIQLVSTRDGRVRTVDHFMSAPFFAAFGLPAEAPDREPSRA